MRLLSSVAAVLVPVVAVVAWLALRTPATPTAGNAPDTQPLRYDIEYPAVGYSTRTPDNRVTRLAERLESGELTLGRSSERDTLVALLDALEIDTSSQLLVFSKTSLQARHIGPTRPRAIYFNDDTYVGAAQGAGSFEIATMDPVLGPMFFTLDQAPETDIALERRDARCLRCHDSYSMTGGGVPRFLLASGYVGTDGRDISHEGRIITTQDTALRFRWGGWYVTGYHGEQVHLGNLVVRDPAALQDLESLRIGNRADLEGLIDPSPYLADTSDIVALLVIQHQTDVQNAITRARFDAVTALDTLVPDARAGRLAEIAEPLLEALFLSGAAELGDTVRGTSGFAATFEARGPVDNRGRSLRELDLQTRLFEYPLSYLIYSDAFDTLPEPLAQVVSARLREVLDGAAGEAFAHLTTDDRKAIAEILRETKPELLTQ
jgi:hypothetical protein